MNEQVENNLSRNRKFDIKIGKLTYGLLSLGDVTVTVTVTDDEMSIESSDALASLLIRTLSPIILDGLKPKE